MLRILIADDHPIVRQGLKHILEAGGNVRSIEEAENGAQVLSMIRKTPFDVVLLDISMPGINGLETLEEIKKIKASLPVLILSMYPEEEYAVRALKAGAAGYLTKKSVPEELTRAVKKLVRGERYISQTLADFLAASLTEERDKPLHEALSARELQVLRLIVAGKSIKEIAAEMSRSPKTISTFRSRILQKLNMKNNAQLYQYAIKNNLTD
jgi:DNA-binding NarL/FixJ family response regulator